MTSGDGKFLAVPETGRRRGPDPSARLTCFLAGQFPKSRLDRTWQPGFLYDSRGLNLGFMEMRLRFHDLDSSTSSYEDIR